MKAVKSCIGVIVAVAPILACVVLIFKSAEVAESVSSALSRCLNHLVPSLYGFMLIAEAFSALGAYALPSALLSAPARALGLSGAELTAFLMSQLGGYPVGMSLLVALERDGGITRARRIRLAPFFFGAGPGFVSACVGEGASAVFSCCAVASLVGLIAYAQIIRHRFPPRHIRLSSREHSLISAVESAGKNMLNMCAMLLAAAVILPMLPPTLLCFGGILPTECGLAVFEISNCMQVASMKWLPGLLSFGGFCVLMQIAQLGRLNAVEMLRFAACRCVVAVIASIIGFFVISDRVISCSVSGTETRLGENGIFSSLLLLVMTAMLLLQHNPSKQSLQNH